MNKLKRYLLLVLAVLLTVTGAYADSAKQVDFLLSGYSDPVTHKVLAGGEVWTYLDGTSTLAPVWTDKDKGGVATNPVPLDSSGKAEIYGDGIYKFRIYNAFGIFVEEINGLEYSTTIDVNADIESNLKTKVTKIDTIADLRTHTGYTGESVQVLGYYTPGDGGGGPLRIWKEGAAPGFYVDNDGSIIVPGDGSAAWLTPDTSNYNTAEFGILNDGTIETVKVQALLDLIGSSGGGALTVEGQITVTRIYVRYSNVTIIPDKPGDGFTQTRSGITDLNTTGEIPAYAMIHVHPVGYTSNPPAMELIDNVVIKGLTLVGPYPTQVVYQPFGMGVAADNVDRIDIEDNIISNFGGETVIVGGSSNPNVRKVNIIHNIITGGGEVAFNNCDVGTVSRNVVKDQYSQNGIGGNGLKVHITDNTVSSSPGSGITVGGSGFRSLLSEDLVLTGNIITASSGYPIFVTDDGAVTVQKINYLLANNIINGSSDTIGLACAIASPGSAIHVKNNLINGINGTGFGVVSGDATYILTGNDIQGGAYTGGTQDRGLDILSGSPTVIVNGNVITGHTLNDIQGPEDFIIGQNILGAFYPITVEHVDASVNTNPVQINAKRGNYFRNIRTIGGAYTIATPTNQSVGQDIKVELFNSSSSNILAGPFSSAYAVSVASQTIPPNKRIIVSFTCVSIGVWVETGRSAIY